MRLFMDANEMTLMAGQPEQLHVRRMISSSHTAKCIDEKETLGTDERSGTQAPPPKT